MRTKLQVRTVNMKMAVVRLSNVPKFVGFTDTADGELQYYIILFYTTLVYYMCSMHTSTRKGLVRQ